MTNFPRLGKQVFIEILGLWPVMFSQKIKIFLPSIFIQNVINLQARAFKPAAVFTQNFAYQKHTLYPLNREFKKAPRSGIKFTIVSQDV